MYFNYFTQTDTNKLKAVYGVLVCNLICPSFHRFSRQEKDRLIVRLFGMRTFAERTLI